MAAFVYAIVCSVDQHCYIGKTNNIVRRWRSHKKFSCNERLRYAIQKHGIDNFTIFVVEKYESSSNAYAAETEVIQYLRAMGAQLYNFNDGGLGGVNPTQETIERIRRSYNRDPELLRKRGKLVSIAKMIPERRELYSKTAKALNSTPEARKRHSENARRLWQDENFRQKQRDAWIRRKAKQNENCSSQSQSASTSS